MFISMKKNALLSFGTKLKLHKEEFKLKQKKNQKIKAKVNGTVITALLLSFGAVLILWN